VQARRDPPCSEHQRGLDQPGDTRARFEVADVGLRRADDQFVAQGAGTPDDSAECLRFRGVTDLRAGPVGLHVVDGRGVDVCFLEGTLKQPGLRVGVGQADAGGPAVLVDRRAPDDRVDPVAIGLRPFERLEHHDAGALAADVAIGARVEGVAAPIGGDHRCLAEPDGQVRREDQVDPARDGEVAVARHHAAAREVHRRQRRGARGLDRHAGPVEVQQVGDAVRRGTQGVADVDVGVQQGTLAGLDVQVGVVVGGDTDEDAGAGAGQAIGGLAPVLQRLPRHLQQQPVLGVHPLGFPRRDPEEVGIEPVDVTDEAAPAAVDVAGSRRIGVVHGIDVEPVGGELRDRVDAAFQQRPEGGGVARTAR
jgi:hypothetical protein